MPAVLTVVSGPDQGQMFQLPDGTSLVLGRGEAATARLNDAHASRRHCQVEVVGGRAYVMDVGSRGGTFVHGRQLDVDERCEIRPGQLIRVGNSELRFVLDAGVEATTISPDARMKHPAARTRDEDEPAAPVPPPTPTTNLEQLVGKSIGRYQLDSIIARGNSGIIFKATDANHGQPAAVKILWPEFTQDDDEVQRFVRAVQTMLQVKHENLIEVFGAAKSSGYCIVVMEYVDGEPLTRVIHRIGTQGMLDWKVAFRVSMHVARALEAAYDHQIIHRNISPKNILQRKADGASKLGGLLLAKALQGSFAKPVTRAGELVGDVSYMAPERTQTGAEVDCRADIYSLGATAYALLTGRPPFEAPSLPELISQIRREVPEKPKKYQLSIADRFQDVVMTMLEKRPQDRFENPSRLLVELDRIARFENIKV